MATEHHKEIDSTSREQGANEQIEATPQSSLVKEEDASPATKKRGRRLTGENSVFAMLGLTALKNIGKDSNSGTSSPVDSPRGSPVNRVDSPRNRRENLTKLKEKDTEQENKSPPRSSRKVCIMDLESFDYDKKEEDTPKLSKKPSNGMEKEKKDKDESIEWQHSPKREKDSTERERSSQRSSKREKDKERERLRDRERDRHRDKEKDSDRERSRDRERDRDRETDSDRERSRERDRDKSRDKDRDAREATRVSRKDFIRRDHGSEPTRKEVKSPRDHLKISHTSAHSNLSVSEEIFTKSSRIDHRKSSHYEKT